jgi:hypothetical protein
MTSPEDQARENIDRMLASAGWEVRNLSDADISAFRGLTIRNFPLKTGHRFDVVAKDQIRNVIRTYRDKLFTEIFPGRRTSGVLTQTLYNHVNEDKSFSDNPH